MNPFPGASDHPLDGEPPLPAIPGTFAAVVAIPDHLCFLARLNDILDAPGARPAIALVALDCVVRIDSLLGYLAGDQLCGQVAGLLSQALKPEDEVFRVGRNELACLLANVPNEGHALLAAHKILRTLSTKLYIDGAHFHASPHVGVAVPLPDARDGGTLLRQANVAMHEARRRRDRFALYDAGLDEPGLIQLRLQSSLLEAIRDNALYVHFQPKLDLRSGRIAGVETLVRWDFPAVGEISPTVFVPVAEASGFISDLTMRVLNAALCQYAAMGEVSPGLHLAVNLSAKDLQERHLPEAIQQLLGTWNVSPEVLVLELTETALMEEDLVYGDSLDRLKDIGVRLSIDDFGTGYSSMTRLRKLPVDELKLDMSFVTRMLQSPPDERIVRALITLAHDLGLSVVAEGVEDGATLQRLAEFGCDLVQGFHVGKPMAQNELLALLARNREGLGSF